MISKEKLEFLKQTCALTHIVAVDFNANQGGGPKEGEYPDFVKLHFLNGIEIHLTYDEFLNLDEKTKELVVKKNDFKILELKGAPKP